MLSHDRNRVLGILGQQQGAREANDSSTAQLSDSINAKLDEANYPSTVMLVSAIITVGTTSDSGNLTRRFVVSAS